RKLVLEYDRKIAETGDVKLCAEANEKLAAMAKEQTDKALTAVLHESSVTMKNGYNRADN
ncbi:MAG: dipeptidase, partial [Clostridia bacterium]|nr:dipeptidase [Clostridia bacterium]